MRIAAVWDPDAAGRRLCVVADNRLNPVGEHESYSDVSELLARWGGSLESAVDAAGFAPEPIGRFEDLLGAETAVGVMHLVAPTTPPEVWAAGVTYERSREARMHESSQRDIYEKVYDAERPELFFKATGPRLVGPGSPVGLRDRRVHAGQRHE
jgi:hypothetical protein